MEGTERDQSVHSRLNRIVYQSCKVNLNMEGTELAQLFHFCLNRIVHQSM